ncbi:MAG: hypothetical protein WCL39_05920, partial [Armatimonadota bacterium]
QLGACGFPDWVNELPSDLDPTLPGIHMQGCCADATIRASHAVWAQTVTGNAAETRVNMAFSRKSPLVDVISCLPHRGEVDVIVRSAKKVLVRVPQWANRQSVRALCAKGVCSGAMGWPLRGVHGDKKRPTAYRDLSCANYRDQGNAGGTSGNRVH